MARQGEPDWTSRDMLRLRSCMTEDP